MNKDDPKDDLSIQEKKLKESSTFEPTSAFKRKAGVTLSSEEKRIVGISDLGSLGDTSFLPGLREASDQSAFRKNLRQLAIASILMKHLSTTGVPSRAIKSQRVTIDDAAANTAKHIF